MKHQLRSRLAMPLWSGLVRRAALFLLGATCCVFLSVAGSFAQSTFATLTGTITDPSGAPVPRVELVATHLATNLEWHGVSNDVGVYNLAQLREGEYVLRAELPGFKQFVARNVILYSHDVRRIDIRLELGRVQDTIEVHAGAALIETETSRISDVQESKQILTLPVNSRSIWATMMVVPMYANVVGTQPGFAGSREGQYVSSMDGTPTAAGNTLDYHESFQEVHINSVNNSAEFGTLARVNVITKSGSNVLHGSLYDLYTTPSFRSRNPMTNLAGTGVSHLPGFSASGPLVIPKLYNGKNRTFWYVGGDTWLQSSSLISLRPTVPLASWRNGDFSALGIQIRNPFTGEVYADGIIPAGQINPVARKIQERFYPLPNVANPGQFRSRNFEQDFSVPASTNRMATVRLDHKVTERDSVYATFRYNLLDLTGTIWEGEMPAFGFRSQTRMNKALNLVYARTLTPNLVNEFRVGHSFDNNKIAGPLKGHEVVSDLGLQGVAPDIPDVSGVYRVAFTGVGITELNQSRQSNPNVLANNWSIQDQFTWYRGKHGLKAGGQLWQQGSDQVQNDPLLFGRGVFTTMYTRVPGVSASGHPYADFLFGVPTSSSRAFPPLRLRQNSWIYEFFLQDDWKVTPRLTVNLGVRYEVRQPWTEANGAISIFDVTRGQTIIADAGQGLISPLFPAGYVEIVTASSVGLDPKQVIRTDRNNWAPRIGLAYRPFDENTVIRAGYGIFYDTAIQEQTVGGVPFTIAEPTFTNTATPTVVLPRIFPAGGTQGPSTVSLPVAIRPDLLIPYSQQWNVTLEHQRWNTSFRASVVGTSTRQMVYGRNYNVPPVDERLFVDKPRPFPQYPAITFLDNGASHNYHALNLEVQRKLVQGLAFQSSWTWARDLGDYLDQAGTIENPFDRRRDRGPQTATPAHRWTNNLIYDLPFGRGRRWMSGAPAVLNVLAGGWQISTIGIMQTGEFLTPTVRVPDPTGTAFTTGRDRPLVTIRPDLLGDPILDNPTTGRWFEVDAFAAPPIGSFGNAGRGIFTGPGVHIWHLGMFKFFDLTPDGRVRVRIGLTAINGLNHPNWSNPNTDLSNLTARGEISAVGGVTGGSLGDKAGPREFQLNLRVEW